MEVRHNWTVAEVKALMDKPFMDLLFEAQQVHRLHHPPCAGQHAAVDQNWRLSRRLQILPAKCSLPY